MGLLWVAWSFVGHVEHTVDAALALLMSRWQNQSSNVAADEPVKAGGVKPRQHTYGKPHEVKAPSTLADSLCRRTPNSFDNRTQLVKNDDVEDVRVNYTDNT